MLINSILDMVIEMSLVSSVLALVIIFVRAVFRKSLPKNVMFLLWVVLILKLLIPISIPSPTSLYNYVDRDSFFAGISDKGPNTLDNRGDKAPNNAYSDKTGSGDENLILGGVVNSGTVNMPDNKEGEVNTGKENTGIDNTSTQVSSGIAGENVNKNQTSPDGSVKPGVNAEENYAPAENSPANGSIENGDSENDNSENGDSQNTSGVEKKESRLSVKTAVGIAYCIVFFGIAAVLIFMYISMYVKIKRAHEIESEYLKGLKEKLRHGDRIKFCTFRGSRSILVFGIFKPAIILPENYDYVSGCGGELEYLVMHEMQHYYHMDVLFNLIMLAALAVHWFNPLVYISRKLFLRDMETACDSRVIASLPDGGRRRYATVIVDFAQRNFSDYVSEEAADEVRNKGRISAAVGLGFGKVNIKERIRFVMGYKKVGIIAFVISILLISTVIVVFATGALSNADTGNSSDDITEITDNDSKAVSVKVGDDIKEKAGTNNIYKWIAAFLERDIEGCAEIADMAEIMGEHVYVSGPDFRFNKTARLDYYRELYRPLETIVFDSYDVEEIMNETAEDVKFSFVIKESGYELFPAGEYECYLTLARDGVIVRKYTKSPSLADEKAGDYENPAIRLVGELAPYCQSLNEENRMIAPYFRELSDIGIELLAFRNAEGGDYYKLGHTKSEIQASVKEMFGIEDFTLNSERENRVCKLGATYYDESIGMYCEGGRGSIGAPYYEIKSIREDDSSAVVDVQFYGDQMCFTKGPLVRYTLIKTASACGFRFEKIETVSEGCDIYAPYYYLYGETLDHTMLFEISKDVLNKAESDPRYSFICAFLYGDLNRLALIGAGLDPNIDQDELTAEQKERYDTYIQRYDLVRTVLCSSYSVQEIKDSIIEFKFTVYSSMCEMLPVGDYCYYVYEGMNGVCWRLVSGPDGIASEVYPSDSNADIVWYIRNLAPYCASFSYGYSNVYPISAEIPERGVDEVIFFKCEEINKKTLLSLEELQETARELFGFENYQPTADCIVYRDGGYIHYGHGGAAAEYIITDIDEKEDGSVIIDIQFYADRLRLKKSHLIRYIFRKTESEYGVRIDSIEIINTASNNPYMFIN